MVNTFQFPHLKTFFRRMKDGRIFHYAHVFSFNLSVFLDLKKISSETNWLVWIRKLSLFYVGFVTLSYRNRQNRRLNMHIRIKKLLFKNQTTIFETFLSRRFVFFLHLVVLLFVPLYHSGLSAAKPFSDFASLPYNIMIVFTSHIFMQKSELLKRIIKDLCEQFENNYSIMKNISRLFFTILNRHVQ